MGMCNTIRRATIIELKVNLHIIKLQNLSRVVLGVLIFSCLPACLPAALYIYIYIHVFGQLWQSGRTAQTKLFGMWHFIKFVMLSCICICPSFCLLNSSILLVGRLTS